MKCREKKGSKLWKRRALEILMFPFFRYLYPCAHTPTCAKSICTIIRCVFASPMHGAGLLWVRMASPHTVGGLWGHTQCFGLWVCARACVRSGSGCPRVRWPLRLLLTADESLLSR